MFDGNAYWRFIHFMAYYEQGRDIFKKLGKYIGCAQCKEDYQPPNDDEKLFDWSITLHNNINIKLKKSLFTDDDKVSFDGTCDICNRRVPEHIWTFIHNVAETGGVDAIDFLKNVNECYPCLNCRDNLLRDDPLPHENCLYWTFRHHRLSNNANNMEPFVYVMNPSQETSKTACQNCP